MCQLHYLTKFLHSQQPQGHMNAFETHKCSQSICPESEIVVEYVYKYFARRIESSIDSNTNQKIQESNFLEEADLFSELERIAEDPKLSDSDKISLLTKPSVAESANFVLSFIEFAKAEPEIIIHAMILLRRFLKASSWKLRTTNWRLLFIVSIRIAQKFSDHATRSLGHLSRVYQLFQPWEFESLEYIYVKMIDFKCAVSYDEYLEALKMILVMKSG